MALWRSGRFTLLSQVPRRIITLSAVMVSLLELQTWNMHDKYERTPEVQWAMMWTLDSEVQGVAVKRRVSRGGWGVGVGGGGSE